MWSEADGDDTIETLIDGYPAAFHRAAPRLFVDLKRQIVVFDGVVACNGALGLDAEDSIEIGSHAGNEGGSVINLGRDRELLVELLEICSLEESIGLLDRGDVL